eukprot:7384973-Prymnesium_polylepis.1
MTRRAHTATRHKDSEWQHAVQSNNNNKRSQDFGFFRHRVWEFGGPAKQCTGHSHTQGQPDPQSSQLVLTASPSRKKIRNCQRVSEKQSLNVPISDRIPAERSDIASESGTELRAAVTLTSEVSSEL